MKELRGLPVRGLPHAIDLCHDDADLDEIVEGILELERELGGKCELVIVDTVSRALAGGDENQPRDMGMYVRRLDLLRERVAATIMAVHHTAAGGDEPRGHRSLRNAADVRLYATKLADGLSQLEVRHAKDGPSGERLLFRVVAEEVGTDEDGEPVLGAVAVLEPAAPAGEPGRPAGGRLTERQERVLQELRKRARERRSWDFTFAQFAEVCCAAGVLAEIENDSTKRNIARDLRNQLANKGAITVDGKAEKVRLAS